MPYIEENDLVALHQQIDDSNEEAKKTKQELEDVENNYKQQTEELKSQKKKTKKQNIILSLLLGTALAFAIYFYTQKVSPSNLNINEIRNAEATRILDSIHNSLSNSEEVVVIPDVEGENNSSFSISAEESIGSIKQSIKGQKVYSVQIGAFYENRYPSLSETLAGISSNGDMFKYSIGLFKTLKEAQKFRHELVKIGFDDAFVASYVNGRRRGIENPN